MLFRSIKQYAIIAILSTSFFPFNSLTLLFLLKLRIFTNINKICFKNNNDSEVASMFHVVHLIHFFFCWYGKGLLNFVSERIKLVYRINNTRLAFQTSKTTICRPHTSDLSPDLHFNYCFIGGTLKNK